MPTFGNNPGDDPLGIALRSRAADAKQANYLQNFGHNPINIQSDPAWDGFFQALKEQGVSSLADSSVGAKKGMWSPHEPLPSTYDPRFQSTAIRSKSNQIGSPGISPNPSVAPTYNPDYQTSALAGLRMAKPQV
jgi:hypothetical protein